LNHPIAVGWN